MLFDTGQSRAPLTDPAYYPRGMLGWVYRRQARFRVAPDYGLVAQLTALGHPPAALHSEVLSHLHQDHAGTLDQLPGTPLLVSAAELALLQERTPELHGVLATHIRSSGAALTPVHFAPTADPQLAAFGLAHDLFGDGSLTLLPTPGPSPGSMSLLIRRTDAPPLLLVGDVTYDPALLSRGIVPDVGNRPQQLTTAARIARLTTTHPTLRILAAHDPAAPEVLSGGAP